MRDWAYGKGERDDGRRGAYCILPILWEYCGMQELVWWSRQRGGYVDPSQASASGKNGSEGGEGGLLVLTVAEGDD